MSKIQSPSGSIQSFFFHGDLQKTNINRPSPDTNPNLIYYKKSSAQPQHNSNLSSKHKVCSPPCLPLNQTTYIAISNHLASFYVHFDFS